MVSDLQSSPQFISHLHAFRGFAIFNIVAAHCWEIPINLASDEGGSFGIRILGALVKVLFHDSTLYFALISGLLFSLVLQQKGWRSFFKSKLVNVLSPYIVITLLFTYVGWHIGAGPVIFEGSLADFSREAVTNILLGRGFFHLWYIPVLLCLFTLTPAIIWIWSSLKLRWFAFVLMLAPLVVSRVWPEESVVNVIYFLGAYTAGIAAGTNYEQVARVLRRHTTLAWAIFVISTIFLLLRGRLHLGSVGITSIGESLWYVEKLAIAAIVIPWLQEKEATLPHWLNLLAAYAFSIYFLHGILVVAASGLFAYLSFDSPGAVTIFFFGFATLIVTLVVCLASSAALKSILGKRSRMLVGA